MERLGVKSPASSVMNQLKKWWPRWKQRCVLKSSVKRGIITIMACAPAVGKLLLTWPAQVLLGNCLHTCCWKLVTIVACTRAVGNLLLSWPAHVLLGTSFQQWISSGGRNIFQKFKAGFRLFVNYDD
jgi:hypothetical protein